MCVLHVEELAILWLREALFNKIIIKEEEIKANINE